MVVWLTYLFVVFFLVNRTFFLELLFIKEFIVIFFLVLSLVLYNRSFLMILICVCILVVGEEFRTL